jgi:DNA integrity scanning protein DisA with diadenylate cyclase activity
MLAALMQTDLACVIHPAGPVERIGVALRPSAEAGAVVDDDRGMRHRSAARYTWDQPGALAVVVSEDGPVTVFRGGKALSESAAAAAPAHAAPPG